MIFKWECLMGTPSATVTFAVELLFPLFFLKYLLLLLFFVAKTFVQPNFSFSGKVCSVSSLHYALWMLRVMNV